MTGAILFGGQMVFKKISRAAKAKFFAVNIKKMLKELDKVEKQLDAVVEKNPDSIPEEDYKKIKELIQKSREYGEKLSKKKNINIEEYVKFVNEFAEVAEELGKKYNVKGVEKFAELKNVRIDKTADTFDASELDEEELKKLAEELKKKNQ